jgi:hypothetical protein
MMNSCSRLTTRCPVSLRIARSCWCPVGYNENKSRHISQCTGWQTCKFVWMREPVGGDWNAAPNLFRRKVLWLSTRFSCRDGKQQPQSGAQDLKLTAFVYVLCFATQEPVGAELSTKLTWLLKGRYDWYICISTRKISFQSPLRNFHKNSLCRSSQNIKITVNMSKNFGLVGCVTCLHLSEYSPLLEMFL